jgi:hypothetical protein
MKTLLALSVSLAALTLPLKAVLPPVVFVETNLSFTMKMYINNVEEEEVGKFVVKNYATVSIKNSDIIRACGEFDKSARIIKVEGFNEYGESAKVDYYIKDKTQTVKITELMNMDRHGYPNVVDKLKYSIQNGIGTRTSIEKSEIGFFVGDPEDNTTDEQMDLVSIDRASYRRVLLSSDILVELETRTAKVHGDATFYVIIKGVDGWLSGIVEGTLKISGPKEHIPSPL